MAIAWLCSFDFYEKGSPTEQLDTARKRPPSDGLTPSIKSYTSVYWHARQEPSVPRRKTSFSPVSGDSCRQDAAGGRKIGDRSYPLQWVSRTSKKERSVVSGEFDPYHRWLGISPKDQPPNHYRLLAIDRFEPDPEVIRDAAERQMAHVRTYQLGEHVELSQRILNELAAAKACLLDPARKAKYDDRLHSRQPRAAKPGPVATVAVESTPPPLESLPERTSPPQRDRGFGPRRPCSQKRRRRRFAGRRARSMAFCAGRAARR